MAKEHSIDKHKDPVGRCMHRWKHHDPKPLHSGRGKRGKKGPIVTAQKQAIAVCLSIAEKGGDGYSESSLEEIDNLLQDYSDPLLRRKDKKGCPRRTTGKGKWCAIQYPDREFYLEIPEGESCPPGTKGAGGGYCVGNYAEEALYEYVACPPEEPKSQRRSPAQLRADKTRSRRQSGETPDIPRKKRQQGLREAQRTREQQRQQGCG